MKLVRRMYMTDGGAGGSGGAGGGTGTGAGDGGAGGAGNAFDFEAFTKGLDETTRAGLTAHLESSTTGLKSALKAERDTNAARLKELGELKAKAEKGSELEAKLSQMEATAREGMMKATFYESASAAGCRNIKLAWAAAKDEPDKFFKRDETPDMEAIKASFPELFTAASSGESRTNSGTGSNGGAGGGNGGPNAAMNDAIRAAAGFKV